MTSSAGGHAEHRPGDRTRDARLEPGAGSLDAAVTVSGLAGVGSVTGSVTISGNGIDAVDVAVGPAQIPSATPSPSPRMPGSPPGPPARPHGRRRARRRETPASSSGSSTGGGLDVTVLSSTGAFATPLESSAPRVALAVVATLLDIAGAVVLGISEVQTHLARPRSAPRAWPTCSMASCSPPGRSASTPASSTR